MNRKRWIASIVEIGIGTILLLCGIAGSVDEFWSGMGGGLLAVGVLQLIRQIRYNTNAEYKEHFDIAVNDERNKYLSTKAWSWAGYLYVIIAAVGAIAFNAAGQRDLGLLCSMSMCLVLVLYWVCYLVLKRKY